MVKKQRGVELSIAVMKERKKERKGPYPS